MAIKSKAVRLDNQFAQMQLTVDSDNVSMPSEHERVAIFESRTTKVRSGRDGQTIAVPHSQTFQLKTDLKKPEKLGLMLVGWGGNNGSTLTASLLAHQNNVSWATRRGPQAPNFYGSLIMASSVLVGQEELTNKDVYLPMFALAPFVHPNDLVIGGWDINSANMTEACRRAQVLEPDLLRQLNDQLQSLSPLPSYYHPDFIASNQADRANNCLTGTKQEILDRIRQDIREFKQANGLSKCVVMWTANTERFTRLVENVHFKSADLLKSIEQDFDEISPSTLFAVASILENCIFINGSPQNTLVPAVMELAEEKAVPIAGDDFKSGQTKMKSVLTDFLVSSGIKPVSIVSYNHLGNNDGRNLAEAAQFRSKEISKSNVVDDVLQACPMYNGQMSSGKGDKEGPDHRIVIEYIPAVGDSKRALDEYESEIFMGGRSTISIHNVCEDSLLAAPLMLDLVLLGELLSRVTVKSSETGEFQPLHPVLSLLSFMLKAPVVPKGVPVVNAFMRQRRAIETLLRAINGLTPIDDLMLEQRC